MSLSGKRFLVTGGAGMIGSHIVDLLVSGDNDVEVIVLDNLSKGFKENVNKSSKVKFFEVNIGYEDIDPYFDGIDYVFHQSGYRITKCDAEPKKAIQSMASGAHDIWESSIKYCVKRITFASTASIYGQAAQFPTRETHELSDNCTIYGGLKGFTEALARSRIEYLPYTGFRYFVVYGPRMDGNGKYSEVFIIWYNAIKEGKKPKVNGNGTLDVIFCKDVAEANIRGLIMPPDVYNVCSGKFYYLKDLCDALGQEMKKRGYDYDGYEWSEGDRSYHRWGCAKKISPYWRATTGLEDGIRQLVDYMESK